MWRHARKSRKTQARRKVRARLAQVFLCMCGLHWITIILYISLIYCMYIDFTSSTAQGGGGSFKNRKPIGEIGCCESPMAEQKH